MNGPIESCGASPNPGGEFFRSPCTWIAAAIFLAALGLRLLYICEYTEDIGVNYYTFEQTDNHTFHEWAQEIARGDWLCRNQIHPHHKWTEEVAPEAQWLRWYGKKEIYHQAPLYPYLVAVIYKLFGVNVFYVNLFQAFLGACTCVLVFLTGRLYFGRNAGAVAGLLLALAGFHFYYDTFVLREGLIAFLTMAFVYLASRAFMHRRLSLFIWAGIVLGLGVAAKPTALVLAPIYLIALFIVFHKEARLRRIVRAGLFLLAVLLPLAPLYIRNAALDCPIFKISTRGPTAFINGNLRGQSGTDWSPPARETRTILRESNYRLGEVITTTLKSYIDYPPGYIETLWAKTRAFFNSYEIPNNTNFYLVRMLSRTLAWAFVSYHVLAALALLGMALLLPRLRETWQLYLVTILITLATIAFFIVARFRQPVVPLFAIFAGYSTVWLFKKAIRRRWLALAPAAAALVLLLVSSSHDQPTYSNAMSAYSGAMKKLIAQHDFSGAARFKELLFEENRKETQGHYLPRRSDRLRRIDEAFSAFDLGSMHPPDAAERYVHYARGYYLLLDATKRIEFEEYIEYIRGAAETALAIDPEVLGANKTIGLCLAEQAVRGDDPYKSFERLARASYYLRTELELNPGDLDCLRGLGSLELTFGRIEEAFRYYKDYLALSGTWDTEVVYQLEKLLVYQPTLPVPMMKRVEEMAGELYDHDPKDVRFCRLYADALEKSGKLEAGNAILRELIRLDPESAGEYRERIDINTGVDENRGE